MENKIVYIKPKRNAEVEEEAVLMKDIASVSCTDKNLLAKIKALRVYRFPQKGEKRAVISSLYLIERIQEMEKGITVENVGETDTLVKLVKVPEKKGMMVFWKIVFVSLISFFGTAFTITDVFGRFYEQIMGQRSDGVTILEITYSLGLLIGITLFFNHIGGRRITTDPTPIEVEMRIYEKDVDDTLIETADREGKTIDAS